MKKTWRLVPARLVPKLAEIAREYSREAFRAEFVAGLTVGLVALPLAMAFAIASGVKPEAGIYTAAMSYFWTAFAFRVVVAFFTLARVAAWYWFWLGWVSGFVVGLIFASVVTGTAPAALYPPEPAVGDEHALNSP